MSASKTTLVGNKKRADRQADDTLRRIDFPLTKKVSFVTGMATFSINHRVCPELTFFSSFDTSIPPCLASSLELSGSRHPLRLEDSYPDRCGFYGGHFVLSGTICCSRSASRMSLLFSSCLFPSGGNAVLSTSQIENISQVSTRQWKIFAPNPSLFRSEIEARKSSLIASWNRFKMADALKLHFRSILLSQVISQFAISYNRIKIPISIFNPAEEFKIICHEIWHLT